MSGHNKVPMAELRSSLTAAGANDVATYIQSGNIALDFSGDDDELINLVERVLLENFDVEVPVVVVAQSDIANIIDNAPFDSNADPSISLIYFANAAVDVPQVNNIDDDKYPGDDITAATSAVYVAYGKGQSKSKLSVDALERAAGCTLTGRNLRSSNKLLTL